MTRPALNPRRLLAVFALLVAATLLSVVVGDEHGLGTGRSALLLLIAIAFGKVWLVGEHFMDLRGAPPAARRAFGAYVVALPAALGVLNIVAG